MNGSRQRNAGSAEEATQGGAAQRDFAWVEASVWTERMLSALGNGVKGGKWFSLMDKVFAPKTLAAAWMKVRANKGAAGVDGQSIERFAAKAEDYLAELSAALREGSYRPQAVKRVDIPKGDGRTRPLGIPTVKDRIVQQAVRLVIEPIFETRFRDGSYGFRPGRGCHDALREVDRLIKDGYAHVVDADLASYFNSIPHDRLVARVEEKVSDGRVLDLIRGWLKADILKGLERWTPTRGSPQGAVISPLLANIFLDPLDAAMAERGRRMVRYADDFVILCRTREEADAALAEVRAWVSENGLALHPEKTHVGDCRQPGQGYRVPRLPFRSRPASRAPEEPEQVQGQHKREDAAHTRRQPRLRRELTSTRCCAAGSATSNMPITPPSTSSTGLSGGGCAPSCASRKSAPVGASAAPTINAGQMPSSRKPGCSRFTRPGYRRDSLDEETANWRAVCGKTACTVRREGSAKADPYPYQ